MHVLLVSLSPKFHFVSPYNHLFSRYIYLKYFKLPWNDLEQPKVSTHVYVSLVLLYAKFRFDSLYSTANHF